MDNFLDRRQFLKTVSLASLALSFTPTLMSCSKTEKLPNILFAISDDQSWCHAGAYGCKFVQTPAFDRIAGEGVLFNNVYGAAPQCSPNRASILTGRHIWQNEEAGTHSSYFPKKLKVFTDLLTEKGYFVGYTGKPWSPGNFEDAGWEQNPVGKAFNDKKIEPPFKGIRDTDYAGNFELFLTQRLKDQPFFFWYGASEPHRAYEQGAGIKSGKELDQAEVPGFLPDVEEIRSDLLDYGVEIEWFDKHLSQMIKKLEEAGELDNTMIVVTSDNGMPFPRAKASLYEYGIHLPLAVRWANKVKAGRVVDDFISFIDFAPTFLEAAKVTVPAEITGLSFLPVLFSNKSGQIDKSRDWILTGRERHSHARYDNWGYPARAIRMKEYLFIWNIKSDRWPAGDPNQFYDIDGSPSKTFMIMNRNLYPELYEAAFAKHPEEELYNVVSDPFCMNNLANDPRFASQKNELSEQLKTTLKEQGDPRVLGYGDIFESYPRFGAMRPELGGFAERGKYNPYYQHKAEEARGKN
jgi:N-sulfoglucosamine sulfohydrolase